MKTSEAIHHYGSNVALTAALGLSAGAISQWGEFPPDARQLQIERMTLGAIKAEPECMDRLLGFVKQTQKAA
jgi:DNA-binding transcriptional regulator YdaS (Cro superfamily)